MGNRLWAKTKQKRPDARFGRKIEMFSAMIVSSLSGIPSLNHGLNYGLNQDLQQVFAQ